LLPAPECKGALNAVRQRLLTQKSPNYVSDSGYVIDPIIMPTVTDNLTIFDRFAKLLQVLSRVL
jgi:hypothetical protein